MEDGQKRIAIGFFNPNIIQIQNLILYIVKIFFAYKELATIREPLLPTEGIKVKTNTIVE